MRSQDPNHKSTPKVRETLRIKEMNESERPQEKLLALGPKALSTAELIALIIRTGTTEQNVLELSRALLAQHQNSLYQLYKNFSSHLDSDLKGLATAKVSMLLAALEIGVRLNQEVHERDALAHIVKRSESVYHYMHSHFFGLPEEELWVLTVNAASAITSAKCVSRGGISETLADPKVILRHVLSRATPAMILMHNHPSGNATPSCEDDALTTRLRKACDLLDIQLLDHIIYTDNSYYSYCDEGRL